jgi:hypothetical protein
MMIGTALVRADPLRDLCARQTGEHDVEQDEVGPFALVQLEDVSPSVATTIEALGCEPVLERVDERGLVLHHHDLRHLGRTIWSGGLRQAVRSIM